MKYAKNLAKNEWKALFNLPQHFQNPKPGFHSGRYPIHHYCESFRIPKFQLLSLPINQILLVTRIYPMKVWKQRLFLIGKTDMSKVLLKKELISTKYSKNYWTRQNPDSIFPYLCHRHRRQHQKKAELYFQIQDRFIRYIASNPLKFPNLQMNVWKEDKVCQHCLQV